jgi:asparagine synthase (glutamine-hydrolysing)
MSGVFGVLDSKQGAQIEPLLTKMGAKMAHREWYVVETHSDENVGVGLGRIGIGIFNQERQPLCSEDRNLMVFLSGEFYGTTELRHDLKAKGHRFRDDSDLELVLRLYEERGEQFIHDLKGAFVLAIWNRPRRQLIIANDRFGLYPLYYAHYDSKLVFAPEMKGILCDPHFRKELDLTALAEYMRFQQLLGQKTFFEGLELFPNASVLSYQLETDQLDITSYWDFSKVPELSENVSYEEVLGEAGRLLRRAVNRMVSGPYRVGVYLSGGLDSRTMLGLIDCNHFPVTSITYGQKNCRDVVYAERIARKVGSDHHWFEFKSGEWVKEWADFHFELTEGFHSWIHSHGMSTLPQAREVIDINLTGWAFDTSVGGHWWDPLLTCVPDDVAFNGYFFRLYNQKYTWPGIEEAEERFLYNDAFYPHVQGLAFESFVSEVTQFDKYDYPRRAEFFNQVNHNGRLTYYYLIFTRSHVEIRFPACDYQLFDFVCSIPLALRANRRMEKAVINREISDVAMIPYDKDGLLLTDRWLPWVAHALTHKLKNRFNRHFYPVFRQFHTLYADYENYLRSDLRSWAEDVLFDKRTLERGIFNPQFIRSIWARHQSGKELHTIGKIAPIMTYEMMLRRFYD